MTLYLPKVIHPQAHDNYRVILKTERDEVEIGSIGIQHGAAWTWGIAAPSVTSAILIQSS